jgi:hypothetical protein
MHKPGYQDLENSHIDKINSVVFRKNSGHFLGQYWTLNLKTRGLGQVQIEEVFKDLTLG